MFIQARKIEFLEGVKFNILFQDGKTIQYDLSSLFKEIPQFKVLLEDRKLFLKGKLDLGGFGIVWNDDLDLDVMEVYYHGVLIKEEPISINDKVGVAITRLRESKGLTQTQLSKITGIDQGDISKIEWGKGNPTIKKLEKIANGLGVKLEILFK